MKKQEKRYLKNKIYVIIEREVILVEEKNEDKINEKEELEKTDSIKEEEIKDEKAKKEEDNITREINLDELYDGAINNTVIIYI